MRTEGACAPPAENMPGDFGEGFGRCTWNNDPGWQSVSGPLWSVHANSSTDGKTFLARQSRSPDEEESTHLVKWDGKPLRSQDLLCCVGVAECRCGARVLRAQGESENLLQSSLSQGTGLPPNLNFCVLDCVPRALGGSQNIIRNDSSEGTGLPQNFSCNFSFRKGTELPQIR